MHPGPDRWRHYRLLLEVGVAGTKRYLGASTPFGVIIAVGDAVYNAEATVRAEDGGVRTYRLPFLIAHGVVLAGEREAATSGNPDRPGRRLAR